jgi:hypothetical protein
MCGVPFSRVICYMCGMKFVIAMDAEIAEIEADLGNDPRYVKLLELKRLRSLYMSDPVDSAPVAGDIPTGHERKRRETSPWRAAAIKASMEFLEPRSGPTKTADIFAHLRKVGIEIRGSEPKSNLSALLHYAPEFVSHGRAGWTLKKYEAPNAEASGASNESAEVNALFR